MSAVSLVLSSIIHTRHQPIEHRLERKGLSLWLDLDRLDEAHHQSALFSVGGFNLLSFHAKDHGPNFLAGKLVEPLADYARRLAREVDPAADISRVMLLTFPRILGKVFNPISVYRCFDARGEVRVTIYEVRNTFGDIHSYIASGSGLHEADKIFHVSPFLPVEGEYRLRVRQDMERISIAIRYAIEDAPMLTATLRGHLSPLSSQTVLKGMVSAGQWPMRPLLSIHVEALKLVLKKVPFFRRPEPPAISWSLARNRGND